MTNWWIVVDIPGWVASSLTHLPEANSVESYRSITRYTDNTFETLECINGTNKHYSIRIRTDERTVIHDDFAKYDCSIRQIEKGHMRSTSGSVGSLNTKYWNIYTADGTFQVHKTVRDESEGLTQWTVEIWGDVPDADTLIQGIRKYISQ